LQNTEGENTILLNHLQPGTYTIDVRAMSGTTCSQTKTITLTVTPPWYRSKWAYALYFVVIIGIIIGIGFSYRRRAHRLLAEEKMRFLINATHDIRSPLTIIMGAIGKLKDSKIEELKSEEELQSFNTSTLQPSIDTIDRNAQRLLQLVNQILDQRRLDKKQTQLHCQETNMVEFISGVCKLYQFGADQRNIAFTFEHERDHVLAWIDRINFDKVISNLLSNAFKYTYDNGEVKVVLHETEKNIELSVIDNGMGFKDEDPNRFFDRFYQGQNSANLGIQGTGIGLNLCRAITEMHGGEIKALRREDKQGACFVVTIPKGNKHLRPEQVVTDSPVREVLSSGIKGKKSFRQFRILIVDDEPEIARYIISELGDRYKFDHAVNGKEALKMLLTDEYDLVISDMMMPEMDGLTLLKHIKDNTNISQIPVIMLTSKAEVEYKLEGLRGGADAYIAKPFDMEELHIQIDNLIDNVRRLKGKFSGALKQEERVEQVEVKGNDDALMDRIMRSVNANFSDPDYNVDTMANDVGISRAQLHRKMKEITGVSTGKFLRNLRMEQAARLLREGKINVSQIADRVGYADQAHFSTAFKTHFGQSPSEYAETHKE
jgi:signal transduction histidine kinase/DNA-binding response OmpR family regulator